MKLKSTQTPWEDKIKLARFAWISSQCLLPNKEQVLLDWCTHALTGWYNKKVEFPQNVLESLWCYLDDLLHSRKLYSFLKQRKPISLRLNTAQLLLDRLQDYAQTGTVSALGLSTLLSVCQGILSTPALSSVFTTKYELMVALLARLVNLACHELQQLPLTGSKSTVQSRADPGQCEIDMDFTQSPPAYDADQVPVEPINESLQDNLLLDCSKPTPKTEQNLASANLFQVLLQALTCYLSVQRQQANPNRVFTLVTNQLFQPVTLLRHLLCFDSLSSYSQLPLSQQTCRDIRSKMDTILQLALFPPEHMALYQEELVLSKVESGKRGLGGTKGPLRPTSVILSKLTAQSFCEPSLHYTVKSNTVSLLFKLFLESYEKRRGERNEEQGMLYFFFLTSLLTALDVGLDIQTLCHQECPSPQNAPCSPESWSLALLAVESLLNCALSADIYNVAADRIRHGEVQLQFYRALAEMLFQQAQPSIPAWYRCLKALLSLNHLILEPNLAQLLSLAWVNADSMDARVQCAKQLTVCSLLQTYTKLRQLPHFFSELLSVICQPVVDQLPPPLLFSEVTATLRTCLLDTPPSQAMEICSLVLKSIKKNIPPLVEAETAGEMDIDYEVTSDAENKEASLKILSLSQLLHFVLFSLKTLDNASPLPFVRQSQNFMEAMHQVIIELQQRLAKMEMQTKLCPVKKTLKKGKKKVVGLKTTNLWKQNTMEATLLLRYTWVEVDTLFSIHCSKYTSLDTEPGAASETGSGSPLLVCIKSLLSGEIFTQSHVIACSPMSSLLLRHLILQQMKKVLIDPTVFAKSSTKDLLNRAAHFITAKDEIEKCLNVMHEWDGQISNVNASSYLVAYWYLVTSSLPLLSSYLSEENMHCIAKVLASSQLMRPKQEKDLLSNSLTISLISSQLLKSHFFAELPLLFSATVQFLLQRLTEVFRAAHKHKTYAIFQEKEANSVYGGSTGVTKEALVEGILASLTNGETHVQLSNTQTKEVLKLLQILEILNPNGMSSDDLTTSFLLLLFMLTSTSNQSNDGDSEEGSCNPTLLKQLLKILISLLESTSFPSVLKFIHGGPLLQAAVSFLLSHRNKSPDNSDWLDLVRGMQCFIRCLVQLIITRSSSVRLNLNQFVCYLTSKQIKDKLTIAPSPVDTTTFRASLLTTHILLASLSAFSQILASNLGRSKPLDQTLTQMLTQTTATLGLAVQSVLKPNSVMQTTSILSQGFVVEVVTVMLQSELSLLSLEENKQTRFINHMAFYRGFCQQILKEINSAPRPTDFLVSSFGFLSTFYSAVKRTEQKQEQKDGERSEMDELYMQILHSVQRLLTAQWLSSTDLSDLEPALQALLCHLVEKCTTEQFNLLLLMIKEGLDTGKLRAGNYREVLSAIIIMKLLLCCPLPEPCSNAMWLIAPKIISAMMFLVKTSSQDASLNLPFTVPVVTAMTSLLRQGEGLIANPHHVTMVFGALQSVPLDRLTPVVYQSTFMAVHEALFAIIKCHPQVMLNAAPSFLNVFYRLVASIMREGKQRKDGDTDSDVYLQCSRLVERMYSHIAATAESFTTFSAFIVAQYVTELQKVTLRPDIKLHLTEGIYLILDLCLEQDVKFLMAGLHLGVREVFNELYSSYSHYHKAQRQGEDKYTV